MKRIFILLSVALLMCLHYAVFAQAATRYFQFTTSCGHGNWQDTAYVAGTSDPVLIAKVLAELQKPKEERQFISGEIAAGSGGHNRNAGHWFKWHFKPGQWTLVDVAMEVCDGCPYSDVDADTTYWLHTVERFCSWGGQPVKEIAAPTAIPEQKDDADIMSVYPNPASGQITLTKDNNAAAIITIYNAIGQQAAVFGMAGKDMVYDVSRLPQGCYYLKMQAGDITSVKQLIIQH